MPRESDKLVRDSIPEIIKANGEEPTIHIADDEEYTNRLEDKLAEEAAEYRESRDIEELVDIIEVVHAIRRERGLIAEEL
jgi:predicted house-cleaning noncanonical NTP pyrophosphatase (MazG superfamily)